MDHGMNGRMDHRSRRERLGERLVLLELDVLIVTRLPNVRYLTGFMGSNAQVVVARDGSGVFLTDGRYEQQATHEVPDLDRYAYRQGYPRPLLDACGALDAARAGFERRGLTFDDWTQLGDAADGLELVPAGPEVEALRRVKDADELELIGRAQRFTDDVFERVVLNGGLRAGVTERQLACRMEIAMLDAGTERAFEPIVAFGAHAAEPHHHPTDRELMSGDVVKLDFGALADGYHSDMTRTVAFGDPDPRLREIRDVVAAANGAGIDAVRPGASTVEVDAAARAVVADAGFGDAFPHGLGHGVGLEIHEDPFLRWHGGVKLEEGMVVTVEPGVYIPGLGGVRIEDMVEVTADGGRPMPRSPKELIVL
jgi:Xaa-Pro aminopeptidase